MQRYLLEFIKYKIEKLKKIRQYKDITVRIEISSDNKEDLDKASQEVIKGINAAAVKAVDKITKNTLIKKGKDVIIGNICTSTFPK